jgi:hypothetical protein
MLDDALTWASTNTVKVEAAGSNPVRTALDRHHLGEFETPRDIPSELVEHRASDAGVVPFPRHHYAAANLGGRAYAPRRSCAAVSETGPIMPGDQLLKPIEEAARRRESIGDGGFQRPSC